ENVSWEDVHLFIAKVNTMTGKSFRLPTEAEWEFAAKGGNQSRGFSYSGSNSPDNVAWHQANSGGKTHPVGLKRPNELGLYDMSGNVYEWCADQYKEYNIATPTSQDRVRRGGSWRYQPKYCRVLFR